MCAEGEHGEGDERLVAVEPERDAGEQPDLRVRRLDQALRQTAVEGSVNRSAMCADAALEVHEGGDAGTARPFDPSIERDLAFFAIDCEHVAQSFFEEVRAPQSRGGLRDPVELVALPTGEITRVLQSA